MPYSIYQICDAVQGRLIGHPPPGLLITHLFTDSRQVTFAPAGLFFALVGPRRDGHDFLGHARQQGIRFFVVQHLPDLAEFPEACFIQVPDTLQALQSLAAWHRRQFDLPVIGITGSNGKTIVKEWLFQLLYPERHIVRSPRSFNSQTGVPLSVWAIAPEHELAIFEAGISRRSEMAQLAPVIQCTLGIFTCLGDAHSEGFASQEEKLNEKLVLFASASLIFYGADDPLVDKAMRTLGKPLFRWGAQPDADLQLLEAKTLSEQRRTLLKVRYQGVEVQAEIPFADQASITNAMLCWSVLLYLGIPHETIRERLIRLEPVEMRLEMREAINECVLINDSYNSDLSALAIALDFMARQAGGKRRTLILSDILESSRSLDALYNSVADLICEKSVHRVLAVGEQAQLLASKLPPEIKIACFDHADSLLQRINAEEINFQGEIILLKGARRFGFERIASRLARKVHQTTLEIHLGALVHNLRQFQQLLAPGVRTMVMVKAAAYGSGSVEIAKTLEQHQVDYLAVAYADEGVELRRNGVQLPIMVLNPEEAVFDMMLRYRLEPELYSLRILRQFARFCAGRTVEIPVHLKIETGMHRLGFVEDDLEETVSILLSHPQLRVISVFSHLAAAENPAHDAFTHQQAKRFQRAYAILAQALAYRPLRHLLNSNGTVRFPEYQMDMTRLGIGLYGLDVALSPPLNLQVVLRLKAAISQIKCLQEGDTVGYGRRGMVQPGARVATISIGYADGLLRAAGNGCFSVLVHGRPAPIIGSVCMDMCMVDVSHIPQAQEGDPVIIFGPEWPVQYLTQALHTIPYEVLTGISPRVKRVYIQE